MRRAPKLDLNGPEGHSTVMDAAEPAAELSFEAALARLEEIVRILERGEAPLDQSIELYQEGDRLKRHCEARLKAAQARIEQIALGADGKPSGVTPFDGS
jgi:exodeoxyribonuclease VII small subunit